MAIPENLRRPAISSSPIARRSQLPLKQQLRRMFEQLFERLQEFRTDGAVDDAVVATERDAHRFACDNLPGGVDHGFILDGADTEDRRFGWIDDRKEMIYAEHAQV